MIKKMIVKILCIICSIFIIDNTYCASKNEWPVYQDDILGEAGFVMDANSNYVLYEKNPDKKMYPASITKIMTAIVVLDSVEDLNEKVFFSYNACNKDIDRKSTVIGATAGDKLSVIECLYAILLPSANDVANALAEHVAGNINDFALLMNEKALELGMTNTHFTNPSGLQNENHYTTARDMAIMLNYAMKNETFMRTSSSISYTHEPIRKYKNPNNSNNTMLNTNNLIIPGSKYYYKYTTSGKTGYTKDAGYCLAASSCKDDMNLIVVTLNSKKINDRFLDAKNLFDYYFKNYKSLPIKKVDDRFNRNDSSLAIANVDLVKNINLTCDDISHITLPKNVELANITSSIHFTLKNNHSKNAVGYIEYYYGDKQIGECEIIGENLNNNIEIDIQNLDISTVKNKINNSEIEILEMNNYVNEDSLFYIDKIGQVRMSKGFKRLLIVIGIILIIIILAIFAYSKIFMNIFESIDFMLARIVSKRKKKKLRK